MGLCAERDLRRIKNGMTRLPAEVGKCLYWMTTECWEEGYDEERVRDILGGSVEA